MKMTAGVELVREEGGGEGGASFRDGRREDDEGVQDLLSAEPGWPEQGDPAVAAGVSAGGRVPPLVASAANVRRLSVDRPNKFLYRRVSLESLLDKYGSLYE